MTRQQCPANPLAFTVNVMHMTLAPRTMHLVSLGTDAASLAENGPGLPVILVIVPPSVTHGQLMTFLAPALPTHSTIHVFLKE
jgi:hypothetical protein